MLAPFAVAAVLLLGGLLVYGTAMHLVVRVVVGLVRGGPRDLGYWRGTAVMAVVTAIMAAAHLVQVALWAAALRLCGQASDPETALYLAAQSYTSLGYGDVPMAGRWRLLGPLAAVNGLLFFGLSTAVLFAILSQLVAHRLRAEAGYRGETAGGPSPHASVDDIQLKN